MSAEVETLALPGNDMTVNISKKVLEADILISAPKFKTHILTTISGAIKNSFGFVVGGDKRRLHRDFPDSRAFSRMLVDVYRIRIPDLVIMDGVVGMQGNGPTSKQLYPVGKILASDNGVSLDGVMASMMGARPEKVAMLSYANQLGLGEIDTSRIDIDGDAGGLKKFRRPMTAITRLIPGTLIQTFLPGLDHPRFEVDAGLCNTCCQCADICPGKAIAIEDSLPRYDYSKCISCYCCMELCPQQAIERQENVLFRLYRKLGIFH
jgi:ferredoxin